MDDLLCRKVRTIIEIPKPKKNFKNIVFTKDELELITASAGIQKKTRKTLVGEVFGYSEINDGAKATRLGQLLEKKLLQEQSFLEKCIENGTNLDFFNTKNKRQAELKSGENWGNKGSLGFFEQKCQRIYLETKKKPVLLILYTEKLNDINIKEFYIRLAGISSLNFLRINGIYVEK